MQNSTKKNKPKFLYLTTEEIQYLMQQALILKMYFKHPNEVMRYVLNIRDDKNTNTEPRVYGLESQENKRTKVRVDEEVWKAWKMVRARKDSSKKPVHLGKVIEWYKDYLDAEEDALLEERPTLK
jgi:hypothetical protein